jgi:hypothetical protein
MHFKGQYPGDALRPPLGLLAVGWAGWLLAGWAPVPVNELRLLLGGAQLHWETNSVVVSNPVGPLVGDLFPDRRCKLIELVRPFVGALVFFGAWRR